MKNSRRFNLAYGFTIVELLIVIVIIGILAAITIVSYTGITQRASEAVIKSDLDNATKVMMMEYAATGQTPTVFPGGFKNSNNIGLSLSATGNANTFCVNAQTTNTPSPTYMYYLSSDGAIKNGSCSGNVIAGSEKNLPSNIVTDGAFTNLSGAGWRMVFSDNAGYSFFARGGTLSDPIENKPVLNITNNTAKTESWAIISGKVRYADITLGGNYKFSIYVRRIGSFSGGIGNFSVRDDNSLNPSLIGLYGFTPSDSWRLYSFDMSANANGISSNNFYLPINNAAFNTTGWSLEFQDPQLVRI